MTTPRFARFASLAIAGTLASAFAVPVMAQSQATLNTPAPVAESATQRPDGPRGKSGMKARGAHGHGMHAMHAMHGERMLRGLDLTEAQRDEIFAIRHAAAPDARDAMKAGMKAHRELRELTRADAFDDARAETIAREGADAMARAAVLRARTQHQVLAVLTPEQRSQLDERRERAQERHAERREGRHDRSGQRSAPAKNAD